MPRGFITPNHSIRIRVNAQLDAAAFRTVRQRIHEAFPELAQLAAQRQAQTVYDNGVIRILPVRGGEIPAHITNEAICDALASLPSQPHAALWAEAATIRYARRGR